VAAETYTEAQLKASSIGNGAAVADYEVMANGLAVVKTASGSPIAATGTYLKIGDDKFVKIVSAAAGAPVAGDGPTAPIVNTSIGSVGGVAVYLDEGAASTADKLSYSLTSLDITKDLVGPTGVTLTAEQSLDAMISFVDKQYQSMTSAAADLGSVKMRIELQENFVNKLTDSLDKGIGRLVDAEMNEESTRLKALQTQQQLAVQALSIANNDSQSILSLFR
jgi:flagellin